MTAMPAPADGPTAEFAAWIAAGTGLPADVLHQSRRILLDALGAALVGSAMPSARLIAGYVAETERATEATVLGGGVASAAAAALINGAASHGVELDDGYTPGSVHPGAVVVPAAFAAAERRQADFATLLRAIAVGTELVCRVAGAGHPATWERGFHNTPLAGVFGAAAATAVVDGLPAPVVTDALGIAGSHSGGLFAFIDSGGEVKRLHAGRAARDGVLAADLAAAGLTGPPDVFEARRGYFAAFAGDARASERAAEGLGDDWAMLRTYVKPYPCCRHLHGPIDAALALRGSLLDDLTSVTSIVVETYGVAAEHGHHTTTDLLEAQMSIPYAVAVALLDGEVGLRQFERDRRLAADTTALAAKVRVVRARDLDARYPSQRPARLLVGGSGELVAEVAQPLGEPANPIDDEGLVDKVRRCAGAVVGMERALELADACLHGNDLGRLSVLVGAPVDTDAVQRM